jgi:flagellar FliJ protein
MHTPIASLQLLLERAEAERDAVQARLRRAAETLRRHSAQASQLLAYRAEYRGRAPATGERAAAIALVLCHRDFMQRLDQAIAQQQGLLEQAERDAALLRGALVAQETRVAAVRKLIERRTLEARRQASRTEQRRSDEAAQRAVWALRASGGAQSPP